MITFIVLTVSTVLILSIPLAIAYKTYQFERHLPDDVYATKFSARTATLYNDRSHKQLVIRYLWSQKVYRIDGVQYEDVIETHDSFIVIDHYHKKIVIGRYNTSEPLLLSEKDVRHIEVRQDLDNQPTRHLSRSDKGKQMLNEVASPIVRHIKRIYLNIEYNLSGDTACAEVSTFRNRILSLRSSYRFGLAQANDIKFNLEAV